MFFARRILVALLVGGLVMAGSSQAQVVVVVRRSSGSIHVRRIPPSLTRIFRTGSQAARATAARSFFQAGERVRDFAVVDLSAQPTQRQYQFYLPTAATPSQAPPEVLTEVARPTVPDRQLFLTAARWATEEAPWTHLFTYREGESVLAYSNGRVVTNEEWKIFDPLRDIRLDDDKAVLDLIRRPVPVAVAGIGIPARVANAWAGTRDGPLTFITPSSPYYERAIFTYTPPKVSVTARSVAVFDFLPRLGTEAELERMGLPLEIGPAGQRVSLAPIWRMARADIDLFYQDGMAALTNKTDLLRTLANPSDKSVIIIIAHSTGADIRLPDGSLLTLEELQTVRLAQAPARAAFVISCSQAASKFEAAPAARLASALIQYRLGDRVYASNAPMSVWDALKFLRDVKRGDDDDATLAQRYAMSTSRD